MAKRLEPWRKGDVLTARRLDDIVGEVNLLNDFGIDLPAQPDKGNDPAVQDQINDEPEEPEEQQADAYTETSRVVSTVQIFDQNDTNYALIDRIDSITFTNSEGKTLTLSFSNPVI